jgi:hypothetical protein
MGRTLALGLEAFEPELAGMTKHHLTVLVLQVFIEAEA